MTDIYNQRLKLSGSFAKHEYEDFKPSSVADYSGNTMPSSPKIFGTVEYQIKPIPEMIKFCLGTVYVGSYWINEVI